MEKTCEKFVAGHHTRFSRFALSATKVLDIFRLKTQDSAEGKISAVTVAKVFGISSKTVRDIWTGRSWYRTTHQLEPNRADADERLQRHVGRPKGAKDRKPRTRRHVESDVDTGKLPILRAVDSRTARTNDELQALQKSIKISYNKQPNILQPPLELNKVHESYVIFESILKDQVLHPASDFDGRSSLFDDPFHDDWQNRLRSFEAARFQETYQHTCGV